ncbi:hypothetical protein [Streptomyces albidoflavus]|uniref:hypothetical protein n=1 Tax=Streptomyces albidoflavus TaxID=1886 RepID=UPI00340F7F14
MRKHLIVGAIAACLALTGCSEQPADEATPPAASTGAAKAPDEAEPDGDGTGGDGTGGDGKPAEAGAQLSFGKAARTVGDEGTGVLEITPTTVVYADTALGYDPDEQGNRFAVVTLKVKAATAVAAQQAPPITGGGWSWIAADGEAIDAGNGGSAASVTPGKYTAAGPVQPGSHQWDSAAWELTPEQAKGGTLVYVDGEGVAHRWEVPSKSSGPQVAELEEALEY